MRAFFLRHTGELMFSLLAAAIVCIVYYGLTNNVRFLFAGLVVAIVGAVLPAFGSRQWPWG